MKYELSENILGPFAMFVPMLILMIFIRAEANSVYKNYMNGNRKFEGSDIEGIFDTAKFAIFTLLFFIIGVATVISSHTTAQRDYARLAKKPRYLIINDEIKPVVDTLIVVKSKTKTDTLQIEDFYKHEEYKK